ncbi:MAG TPA: DUF4399 domain-containing protein [Rhodanobacteraceae bacterium]|nr:DUF4399 domain-containing protein [Rhodanobacteraceae bacterium]
MKTTGSLIVAALLLGSGFAVAQDAGMPARTKAPSGAKVEILSPQDGATVSQDVTVKFGVEGIALKPAGDPAPESGHHHLLIDATGLPPLDAPIPNDATHKHYGKAQTGDTIHLSPGTHTLQLDFGDSAHRQFDPPIVSKKITVHVK